MCAFRLTDDMTYDACAFLYNKKRTDRFFSSRKQHYAYTGVYDYLQAKYSKELKYVYPDNSIRIQIEACFDAVEAGTWRPNNNPTVIVVAAPQDQQWMPVTPMRRPAPQPCYYEDAASVALGTVLVGGALAELLFRRR